MSLFKLPNLVHKKIDRVQKDFGWGSNKDSRNYYAPKSWDYLCQPKSLGELGFEKADDSNKAMLSKTAWALVREKDNLAMQILKARYGTLLLAENRASSVASQVWKGLQWCKNTMKREPVSP